ASCDWASMLARMYARWADRNGFKCSVVDSVDGEETGVRNVTLAIKGDYAYGYLKSEVGVHRLVRLSPFDAKKRRHTSFASVDLVPEIADTAPIEVNPTDLEIGTFRSGVTGGPNKNNVEPAVAILRKLSGVVSTVRRR